MIEPYMIGLWIGTLSFVFIFCTIMDMITVPKDDTVITYQDRPFEIEEEDMPLSYIKDDYDEIGINEEDSLFK
jgi:hypothetical protein